MVEYFEGKWIYRLKKPFQTTNDFTYKFHKTYISLLWGGFKSKTVPFSSISYLSPSCTALLFVPTVRGGISLLKGKKSSCGVCGVIKGLATEPHFLSSLINTLNYNWNLFNLQQLNTKCLDTAEINERLHILLRSQKAELWWEFIILGFGLCQLPNGESERALTYFEGRAKSEGEGLF